MRELDCRGLPCPQPVLKTKEALEEISEGEVLEVLVDNEAALKNVTRFAEAQGHQVKSEAQGELFRIRIQKQGPSSPVEGISCAHSEGISKVLVIASDKMGEGDPELGVKLLKAFIKTLREVSPKPQSLIFFNRGVFLTTEGSPVLEDLKVLEKEGVEILSCWTCLSHYGLEDRLEVGQASNMYEILSRLVKASSVIRP